MLDRRVVSGRAAQPAIDALCIVAMAVAAQTLFASPFEPRLVATAVIVAAFFITAGRALGVYPTRGEALSGNWALGTAVAWSVALFGMAITFQLGGFPTPMGGYALAAWILAAPAAMIVARAVPRIVARRRRVAQRVGLVAPNLRLAGDFIDAVRSEEGEMVALYEPAGSPFGPIDPRPYWPDVRPLDRLIEDAENGVVTVACFILPSGDDQVRTMIERLSAGRTQVVVVLDDFAHGLISHRPLQLGPFAGFSLFDTPVVGVAGAVKRVEDIVVSGLLIAALSPLLAVVAGLVKATSSGPVLYKQTRYGVANEPIRVWKFRSMRVAKSGDGFAQAQKDDPRVTPLGRFIRRWSIDELPQLFNVFLGDMSLVGPRPHPVQLNQRFEQLIQGYRLRHKVKPGITGLAQVRGYRGETETTEKMARRVRSDMEYIRRWSLALDLEILVRTAWVVFKREGAY